MLNMVDNNYNVEKMDYDKITNFVKNVLLRRDKDISAVFLVGSFARNEETNISDVDLMIISKKKLSDDQQDNMKSEEYHGREFSLLFTNLDLLSSGVKREIPPVITFIFDAKPIYDPENSILQIKSLLDGFSFSSNVEQEILSFEKMLSKISEKNTNEKNFIILMSSLDLAREFLCSQNNPYLAVKHIFKQLYLYNASFADCFKGLWESESSIKIKSIFEDQIKTIIYLIPFLEHKNKDINLISRIENAKDALKTVNYLVKKKSFEAIPIALTESFFLFRGVEEYLGYPFESLEYSNFFNILKKSQSNLFTKFETIWSFFDSNRLEEIAKQQIDSLKR